MATRKSESPPEETPAEESEATPWSDQTQVIPVPKPAERDPKDWKEPSWKDGMFPGDPNVYPDPENPPLSY